MTVKHIELNVTSVYGEAGDLKHWNTKEGGLIEENKATGVFKKYVTYYDDKGRCTGSGWEIVE